MLVKQISVFMENRPGRLAEITKILSDNGIDIRAINIADTTDFGILRMIVNDEVKAEKVLRDNQMTANISDVIAISISDSVGAFSKVIQLLKDKDISIDYIYSFIGEKSTRAVIVLKTSDLELSSEILTKNDVKVLSKEDVNNLDYAE